MSKSGESLGKMKSFSSSKCHMKISPHQNNSVAVNYCSHCGIMFASEYDVKHHIVKGCAYVYKSKRRNVSNDNTIFQKWMEKIKEENDYKWDNLFDNYGSNGLRPEVEIKEEDRFLHRYIEWLNKMKITHFISMLWLPFMNLLLRILNLMTPLEWRSNSIKRSLRTFLYASI